MALRLPWLSQRPMHTDEAVHTIKFASLLENSDYKYDPHEYHGPTLNYFTLIPAYIAGAKKLVDTTEDTFRIVPVFFGLLLIVLLFFLKSAVDKNILLCAAFLSAISPAFVFYSRYYIMEILLVCFSFSTIAFGYALFKTGKLYWSILCGVSLGFMHATKETCILAWSAMIAALVIISLPVLIKHDKRLFSRISFLSVLIGLLSAVVVSVLFYSSFFHYPHGVLDSLLTFRTYIDRGAGGFQEHLYPWYYYFKLLLWNFKPGFPLWSEGLIVLLTFAAFVIVFKSNTIKNKNLWRFIALYSFILSFLYAVIPYKTPWSMLGFYHGFILLAAFAIVTIYHLLGKKNKLVFSAFLIIGISNLIYQSILLNFKYSSDPSSPYVYAHTHRDIFKLVKSVSSLAKVSPQGQNTYIEVICPGDDYWPLPWYFRVYPNVGYFNKVNMDVLAAPIIISKPEVEDDLLTKLYELPPPGQRDLYIPFFEKGIQLRPMVELDLYVVSDLWNRYNRMAE